MNISGLSNSVAPVLSLGIHGWVPVTVIEHHSISPSQVNTYTSTAGGQDEAEYATVCIEALHQSLYTNNVKIEIQKQFLFIFFKYTWTSILPVSVLHVYFHPIAGRCAHGSLGTAQVYPAYVSSE